MTIQRQTPAPGAIGDGRDEGAHPGQAAQQFDTTSPAEIEADALAQAFAPDVKRFCAWRTETVKDRATKVPYADGRKAQSDNPDTWLTRTDAESVAARPAFREKAVDGLAGIGVFLGLISGPGGDTALLSWECDKILIGIDADTCRDPATGEFTRPWVGPLLAAFPSYAEISPSGTGFKIFAFISGHAADKAELSELLEGKSGRQWKEPGQTHPPGIELYRSGRYFTFTGRRLEQSPRSIETVPLKALRTLIEIIGPSVKAPHAKASARAKTKPHASNKRLANGHDHRNQEAPPSEDRPSEERGEDAYWADAPEPLRNLKSKHSEALLAGDFSHLADGSSSNVAFHLAIQCRRADMGEDETRDTLARYPHRDLSKYCAMDPDAERQWKRIWEKTTPLPALEVRAYNLPETAAEVIGALCGTEGLYLRDHRPVELSVGREGENDAPKATPLSLHGVTRRVHAIRRVWQWRSTPSGHLVQRDVTLPERVAGIALDHRSAWRDLPPLEGITSAPILSEEGTIRAAEGYDPATGFFCFNAPSVSVSERPTQGDAEAALLCIRRHFRTFAFADAPRVRELNADVVDTSNPPGADESAALYALLTAICRPSLWLGPGFLCTGASVTGAGAGKGLLVRVIVAIALGMRPSAISPGHNIEELDKRLVAALIDARPVVFIDNVNGATLKSDTLASALTERPASLRVLGKSETASVTAAAFIAITGNGLTVTEDLARRFVSCGLDGGEDAEARDFDGFPHPVHESFARRGELLAAALTIWRWGRQNPQKAGKPIGSFEQWAEWVRDPLLALGCADPADRITEAKGKDPQRAFLAELFATWARAHGEEPVAVSDLAGDVISLLNPAGKMSRQWLAKRVSGLEGTRANGLILKATPRTAKWTPTRYYLTREGSSGIGVIGGIGPTSPPMTPMPPMAYDPSTPGEYEGEL